MLFQGNSICPAGYGAVDCPSMVVPCHKMCSLAWLAHTPGTTQTVTPPIWERNHTPKTTCPLTRALQKLRNLGWQPLRGQWEWIYPAANTMGKWSYLEHLFREQLCKHQVMAFEPVDHAFSGHGSKSAESFDPHANGPVHNGEKRQQPEDSARNPRKTLRTREKC